MQASLIRQWLGTVRGIARPGRRRRGTAPGFPACASGLSDPATYAPKHAETLENRILLKANLIEVTAPDGTVIGLTPTLSDNPDEISLERDLIIRNGAGLIRPGSSPANPIIEVLGTANSPRFSERAFRVSLEATIQPDGSLRVASLSRQLVDAATNALGDSFKGVSRFAFIANGQLVKVDRNATSRLLRRSFIDAQIAASSPLQINDPVTVTGEAHHGQVGQTLVTIDFGDGSEEVEVFSTSFSASHPYTKPGEYTIRVTAVVEDPGKSANELPEFCRKVVVEAPGARQEVDLTDNDDTVTISPDGDGGVSVVANGMSVATIGSDVTELVVNTKDGKDAVTVTGNLPASLISVTINTGEDDDTVDLATASRFITSSFVLNLGGGNDTAIGSPGGDRIDGGPGADSVDGRGGDDKIIAGLLDKILGGDGNDTIQLDAFGFPVVGSFSVEIDGGPGIDLVEILSSGGDELRASLSNTEENRQKVEGSVQTGSAVVSEALLDLLTELFVINNPNGRTTASFNIFPPTAPPLPPPTNEAAPSSASATSTLSVPPVAADRIVEAANTPTAGVRTAGQVLASLPDFGEVVEGGLQQIGMFLGNFADQVLGVVGIPLFVDAGGGRNIIEAGGTDSVVVATGGTISSQGTIGTNGGNVVLSGGDAGNRLVVNAAEPGVTDINELGFRLGDTLSFASLAISPITSAAAAAAGFVVTETPVSVPVTVDLNQGTQEPVPGHTLRGGLQKIEEWIFGNGDDTAIADRDPGFIDNEDYTFFGGLGNDLLVGALGNDVLNGGPGTNTLIDDHGDDILTTIGNTILSFIPGSDDVANVSGVNNTVSFEDAERGVAFDLDLVGVAQRIGRDTVRINGEAAANFTGSAFDDTVDVDVILEDRFVDGGDGNDQLCVDAQGGAVTQRVVQVDIDGDGNDETVTVITVSGFGTIRVVNFETIKLENEGVAGPLTFDAAVGNDNLRLDLVAIARGLFGAFELSNVDDGTQLASFIQRGETVVINGNGSGTLVVDALFQPFTRRGNLISVGDLPMIRSEGFASIQVINGARDGVIGRDQDGNLQISRSDGTQFANTFAGELSAPGGLVDVLVADVNGDRIDDVVGRQASNGRWHVALSDGFTFVNEAWGQWSPVPWVDVNAADVNGDGNSDVVGRDQRTGEWWVGLSDGIEGFVNQLWGRWSLGIDWADVGVADMNNDGLDDIVGRESASGNWWVALSDGVGEFVNQLWGHWSPVDWVDVNIADVNGDELPDVVGRRESTGDWWVGLSDGNGRLANQRWGTWSMTDWSDVNVGDVNGDGVVDVVGRQTNNGNWWAAVSNGVDTFVNQLIGHWSPLVNWADVRLVDVTADGRADIVGRQPEDGRVWVANSNGSTSFENELWGTWDPTRVWSDVGILQDLLS